MIRIIILFTASFVALTFIINTILFFIPLKLMDRYNAGRKTRIVILFIITILSTIFITIPICRGLVNDNEKSIARREMVKKEIIKECVEDFLQENEVYLSDQKINDIATDIYNRKEFVDDDDLGFFVKERYLNSLLIIVK